jgi:hypothetical protein
VGILLTIRRLLFDLFESEGFLRSLTVDSMRFAAIALMI